jgi:tartrate-resistant acid phosphatase type 5
MRSLDSWLIIAAMQGLCLLCGCQEGLQNSPPAPVPATRAASASSAPSRRMDFLAMGDWGEDTAAQRQVAGAMARYIKTDKERFTTLLLLGDNFYFKLTGINDPRWQSVFEQVYDPKSLAMPFYACLGNHDYDGDNMSIELGYSRRHPESRFKLPAEWYRVDLPRDKPLVTVIMLDSNKDNISDVQWNRQIEWLKHELAGPRAAWTICCAHHPLFSNGFFWGNGILQKDWGTLFQKYHVDFYLCGHEHNLEHLEIPGWTTSFMIAGGGGAHAHPLARDDRGFSREAFGFVHFELTPDKAIVRYLGTDDKPMHEFSRNKAGQVRILETTPNSPRVNPLKAYLQLKTGEASGKGKKGELQNGK